MKGSSVPLCKLNISSAYQMQLPMLSQNVKEKQDVSWNNSVCSVL